MSSSSTEPRHPPVVLLVGSEAALRDAALAELRTRVLDGGPRDFNEDRFDVAAAGADIPAILVAARTLPMLAPSRLVRVRGVGERRAEKFIAALTDYLTDPVPTTCLVLEAERVDKRQRWVKQVASLGELRECSAPTKPAELRAWIDARLRQNGKRPGRGTSAALVDLVGPDLDRLALEIEKVCLFVGERADVKPEDVSEVTGDVRPKALYELTDAIGARRLGAALRIVNQLIDQGHAPLPVLGALANHFRRLMRARECSPLEAREVQRRLSLHPYAARVLAEQARRFDARRLRSCLDSVRRTDEVLKGGAPLSARFALERLVLAVCS